MTVASMTGYAVASGATPLGTVTLECRSVNSRFLDLTLRLNEDLRFADPLIRETIQKRIARGKVEIRGYITPDENAVPARINAAVLNRIVELQQPFSMPCPTPVNSPYRISSRCPASW